MSTLTTSRYLDGPEVVTVRVTNVSAVTTNLINSCLFCAEAKF